MAIRRPKKTGTPQQPFTEASLFPHVALKSWKVMLPLLALLIGLVWLGFRFNVDDRVIVGGAVLFGLLSSLFAWMVGVLGLIPFVGPLIVKVLAIPIIWLLNALGYLVSFIAIKRGYSKDVLTYRGLTIALIVGIIIGFILGHLI
ncbi:MAG: FUSC family protein [Methylophilaceae bacterium]|jgi:hypothetical protein|uniref:FUSC family protein n=1 Tax=Methylobacillus sp. MM3 TaxID=1848039 RepID=UPI001F0A6B81|nr:FUSC family protein [Methylobacillus sp. MM3]